MDSIIRAATEIALAHEVNCDVHALVPVADELLGVLHDRGFNGEQALAIAALMAHGLAVADCPDDASSIARQEWALKLFDTARPRVPNNTPLAIVILIAARMLLVCAFGRRLAALDPPTEKK